MTDRTPLSNDAALVRTLEALHDAYERALGANDVQALERFFWDSPHVVRFGIAEEQYGAAAIRNYRRQRAPAVTHRCLVRREIATFGSSCASIMSEIEVVADGVPLPLRQSQTWVRLGEAGWRIVSAHVSVRQPAGAASRWRAYVDEMARVLAVPVPDKYRPGVMANLDRIASVAAPLLACSLDGVDPAPVFTP